MKSPTKKRLYEVIHTLTLMHRQRCIVYGCVYGVLGLDKKPAEECIYCGRKNTTGLDIYGENYLIPQFKENIRGKI